MQQPKTNPPRGSHIFKPMGLDALRPRDYHPKHGTEVNIINPKDVGVSGKLPSQFKYISHAKTGKVLGLVDVRSLTKNNKPRPVQKSTNGKKTTK